MNHTLWLVIGFVAAAIYIGYARSLGVKAERHVLMLGLIIAAFIYVGFDVFNKSLVWAGVECLGVVVYVLTVWLGKKHHFVWVGIGWGLHPLCDVCLHLYGPGVHIAPA